VAYLLAIAISLVAHYFDFYFGFHVSLNIFLIVFLAGPSLFVFDAFNPPGITAAVSFSILERPVFDLAY